MSRAKLKALRLEVPTGFSKVYHDDGFVDSIKDHTLMLFDRYNAPITKQEYDRVSGGIKLGMQFVMFDSVSRKEHCHIFYRKNLSIPLTLHIRAHEETHALEFLGHLDTLAKKILEEQRVKVDFRELEYDEIRADIGSIYALFAHGINPNVIYLTNFRSTFRVAREIYEQARLKEIRNIELS